MDMDATQILMEYATKVNGTRTSSMEWGEKFGQTEQNLRDAMNTEKRMESESLLGRTDHNTKANLRIATCMAKDSTNGQMVDNMTGVGKTIK